MSAGGVQTIFTKIKELKTIFSFFCIPSSTQLTISLQVNFYSIDFILWRFERGRSLVEFMQ